MNNKKEILSNLADEVYQAEDALDGNYNKNNTHVVNCKEVNTLYSEVMKKLNDLLKAIDKEIDE